MKAKEIKGLSVSELTVKITEEKAALHRLKLNHSISPLDNPMVIRKTRRNIARLLTELNAKKRAQ
jgi:large subunit ribosomal protein L29